jgi:toluene monooxygenase system protein D
MSRVDRSNWVGPVLNASAVTDSIIEALREEHEEIEVDDRGSYYRVLVPNRCRLNKETVEQYCGHEFKLPSDMERVMPSFKGRIKFTSDAVEWHFAGQEEE